MWGVQHNVTLYNLTNDYSTAKAMVLMKEIRILYVAQATCSVYCYIRMLLEYLDKDEFENILFALKIFMRGIIRVWLIPLGRLRWSGQSVRMI